MNNCLNYFPFISFPKQKINHEALLIIFDWNTLDLIFIFMIIFTELNSKEIYLFRFC